jgi:sodium transport system ATP-binding protein
MIELLTVSKRFGDFYAVQDVSLSVPRGEIFGLLGENGAGKTTILRMISTVLTPTSGTIMMGDLEVHKHPSQVRRLIGVVVGEAVYDRLTVKENLWFFGRAYGVADQIMTRKVPEILERMHLTDYTNKLAGHLSRGNKQKLSIGRALLHNPPVIMMDEPMSGLDVGAQQAVRQLIRDLRCDGKTVIFSSHNMSDVDRLCDRVAIITKGRLSAYGALDQVLTNKKVSSLEELIVALERGDSYVS